jgi:hypothetical protein
LSYKVKDGLNCTRASDVIPWFFEQCQLRVYEILQTQETCIDDNVETEDIVDVGTWMDDDIREPVLIFAGGSKSQVVFVERVQLNQLFHSMGPFKCQSSECHNDFIKVEINDWSVTYSMEFICKDGYITPWFGAISNSIFSVPNVKCLTFHAALTSGLTYTHFSEFFYTWS